jgi:hypothetical protein
MQRPTSSEDRRVDRAVRLTHHTSAAPSVPNGDPDKLRRAARRETKLACKSHRRFFTSGW